MCQRSVKRRNTIGQSRLKISYHEQHDHGARDGKREREKEQRKEEEES